MDLLVSIKRERLEQTGRLFGVQIQAEVRADRRTLANGKIEFAETGLPRENLLRDLPFPVCLFFFTMIDDEGYFRWLREPVVSENEQMSLRTVTNTEFVMLTNEVVEGILTAVNAWYDHRLLMKSDYSSAAHAQ